MHILHEFLKQRVNWYATWSGNIFSSAVHWFVFTLFVSLAFSTLHARVSDLALQYEDSNLAIASVAFKHTSKVEKSNATIPAATEIIVGFKNTANDTKRNNIAAAEALSKRKDITALNAAVFTVSEDDTEAEVVDRIKHIYKNDIAFAEVNRILTPEYVPNDPSYGGEWHLPKIGADVAWDSATGTGVTVAVLDTGVDCTHSELASNCTQGWNVVSNNADTSDVYGHGTKVAGTIASVGDNASMIAGVAYRATIMPVRITNDSQGLASYADMANAILYAADHGARVVNLSYAGYNSQTVASAAQYLAGKGGVLTIAAGNDGLLSTAKNDANMIVVSATDMGDVRTTWSSYGTPVDISAPGLAIYTTARGGGMISMSGTSFAAPIVAASFATILSRNPNLTNAAAIQTMLGTADERGVAGYDTEYGWGRVNLGAAMSAVNSGIIPTVITHPDTAVLGKLEVTSYAVISKTKDTGTVVWVTNLPATGKVRYGTSVTALTGVSDVVLMSTTQQTVVKGLQPRVKYYYQIEALASDGTVAVTPVAELRTKSR